MSSEGDAFRKSIGFVQDCERSPSYIGYENHIDIDAEHKLIGTFEVTPTNGHDSQVFDGSIDPDNEDSGVWADSAYRSVETEAVLEDAGYESHICEKGQGPGRAAAQHRAGGERP